MTVDLIVQTANPAALDRTVQQFGAVVGQHADGSYVCEGGRYRVRCYRDHGFIAHMVENQGYGTVVGSEPVEGVAVPADPADDPDRAARYRALDELAGQAQELEMGY